LEEKEKLFDVLSREIDSKNKEIVGCTKEIDNIKKDNMLHKNLIANLQDEKLILENENKNFIDEIEKLNKKVEIQEAKINFFNRDRPDTGRPATFRSGNSRNDLPCLTWQSLSYKGTDLNNLLETNEVQLFRFETDDKFLIDKSNKLHYT